MVIAALRAAAAGPSWFVPGIDLLFGDGEKREVDVFGIVNEQVIACEVKTSSAEFTEDQIVKDLGVCQRLNADIYVLAATDNVDDSTREMARHKCESVDIELQVLDRADLAVYYIAIRTEVFST
jgi:hypothetical protein